MGAVKASGAVQLISGAGRDHTKRFSELAHRRARLRHHLLRHHLRKPGVLGDVSPSRPFSIWLANPHYRERAMPDKPRYVNKQEKPSAAGASPSGRINSSLKSSSRGTGTLPAWTGSISTYGASPRGSSSGASCRTRDSFVALPGAVAQADQNPLGGGTPFNHDRGHLQGSSRHRPPSPSVPPGNRAEPRPVRDPRRRRRFDCARGVLRAVARGVDRVREE